MINGEGGGGGARAGGRRNIRHRGRPSPAGPHPRLTTIDRRPGRPSFHHMGPPSMSSGLVTNLILLSWLFEIGVVYCKKNQNWSINTKVTFKGRCGLCLAFDCKGHVTSRSGLSISYLHAKFEQNRSINTKVTYKGRCGLCLAFDCKGHVTNHQWWPISYLHAKFEQNRFINTKVTFKGCCGLCLAFVKATARSWSTLSNI